MNSAWRKLWPGGGQERDFQGFETDAAGVEENAIVKEIVSLGKSMGLEVDREDVGDLMQDHSTELTTEELAYIQNEQQEQSAKDEEKTEQSIPSASIKEIYGKCNDVQAFVKKYHCDIVVANRTVNLFNDNVISHFRKTLQTRQKQQTLDKFLIKKKTKRN